MSLPNFHHHPDNVIYIRTADGIYMDTIENFSLDSGITYAGLPDGYCERYYEPNTKHFLCTSISADPQDLSWSTGDDYIENYSTIVAAKNTRLAG